MRNKKLYLIRGNQGLAQELTLGEYERINADHVVIITILKYPQFTPLEWDLTEKMPSPEMILEFLDHLAKEDQTHLLNTEYATIATDRGRQGIKVVEGTSLECSWFEYTVYMFHRGLGQSIIKWTLASNGIWINGMLHDRELVLSSLRPRDYLG